MRRIEIKYHRPILGLTTYSVDVPTTWNELTPDQLCQVAALLYADNKDIHRFRIMLLRILMGLKWHHLWIIGSERLIDLFPFVDFIEKEITLTKNKIRELKIKGIRLFGPIGDFETLTAEEWTQADEAYMDFNTTGNVDDLDRMMAILFRERMKGMWTGHSHWANDYRMHFSESRVNLRLAYIKKVPISTKLAVLLWWKGCRHEWESVFERVFKNKTEGPESFGWQETILKLSGAEFGDHKQTQHTQMYRLMLKMEVTIKDEEYRKEQEDMLTRKNRM